MQVGGDDVPPDRNLLVVEVWDIDVGSQGRQTVPEELFTVPALLESLAQRNAEL
jgi:hypothetical protein